MDLATRKRYHSTGIDASAPKLPALDPPFTFADMMTVHLLNALNVTEHSQKLPLLDDLLARIQWLRQQQQQMNEIVIAKKPTPSSSPKQPENRALDHKLLQTNIQKQQDMLQNMSKIVKFNAQMNVPSAPGGAPDPAPPVLLPMNIPVSTPAPVPTPKPVTVSAPTLVPMASILKSPARPAIIDATPEPAKEKRKNQSASQNTPLAPKKSESPAATSGQSSKKLQTAEELMLDLQQKQRKLLGYISTAHNGNVTDEVLHDYLKHPYVLLKENGVVRQQPNPFFHLMNPQTSQASTAPSIKMLPPTTVPTASRRSTTPIPAPPVLLPQVDLSQHASAKKENTTPTDKFSPPPHLPPQLPLQVPIEQLKSFEPPATRPCNQWSVFSMALPLRLICRCYQLPCRCQKV